MSTTDDRKHPALSSAEPQVREKKTYRSPQLARIGSVRDLTLGGNTTPFADGGASTKKPMT